MLSLSQINVRILRSIHVYNNEERTQHLSLWWISHGIKAPHWGEDFHLDKWKLIANNGMAVLAWYLCGARNEKS